MESSGSNVLSPPDDLKPKRSGSRNGNSQFHNSGSFDALESSLMPKIRVTGVEVFLPIKEIEVQQ